MATLAGTELGEIQDEKLPEESGIIPIAEIADGTSTSSDNQGFQLFVPTRTIMLSVIKVGTITQLRSFYNTIKGLMQNQTDPVNYESDFTGTTISVKILSFKPTYVAGETAFLDYTLELLEASA